jgi:hypothetical protein
MPIIIAHNKITNLPEAISNLVILELYRIYSYCQIEF